MSETNGRIVRVERSIGWRDSKKSAEAGALVFCSQLMDHCLMAGQAIAMAASDGQVVQSGSTKPTVAGCRRLLDSVKSIAKL